MLQGQWPGEGCEYCRDIESAGGVSDRMMHLKIPNLVPQELLDDETATTVTPTILEVYLDNVCNMACLYCWDGFSSQIFQENKKFGRFEQQGVIIDNQSMRTQDHEQLTESLWAWIGKHGQKLKRLHILGGEPFYQKQFYTLLDILKESNLPDLEFNIVTNLKLPKEKLAQTVGSIKQLIAKKRIKRLDITASIDCFGPPQEYVRHGIDLDQWRENFSYLAKEHWIVLNINQTLSGLTIKTIPALIEFINSQRKDREIGHYFSTTVKTHDFLHPRIFGKGFFTKDFNDILAMMPNETWVEKRAVDQMIGIRDEIDNHDTNPGEIMRLKVYLDEIDRRRGLDWRQVFPWLESEVNHVV